MTDHKEQILFKKIFSRYDQLERLRRQIDDGRLSQTTIEKLNRESTRKINEIGKAVRDHGLETPFFELIDRYALDKRQVIIVLGLLKRRLRSEAPFRTGREILKTIFEESYEILEGLSYLNDTSVLISAGIVSPEVAHKAADELLEARFKLSDQVFSLIVNTFCRFEIGSKPIVKKDTTPYRHNLDYLGDLRKLSILYRKRATKVFNYDYWDNIGLGVSESVVALERQIEDLRHTIAKKLKGAKEPERIYTHLFEQTYHLSEEEEIILVTLLFQELTEGNAYISAVDLLKLVSRDEGDLLKQRSFFAKRSTLVKNQLIVLEDMVNGKELTGEVFMPNWVIELMLKGQLDNEGKIDTDARMDFHNYLKNLESSEDFFDNLDL